MVIKQKKSSGLLKIESFGFVNLWTGGRVVKVCDAFIGIAAELEGIWESCPDYYLIIILPALYQEWLKTLENW